MNFYDKLQYVPIVFPALVLSLMLHELAHAWVATRLGDPTPKRSGRLSPNPVDHLDPWGGGIFAFTYLFFSFPFGWSRPVHVNSRNFRNRRVGVALVALAGPFANSLVALGIVAVLSHAPIDPIGYLGIALGEVVKISVVLAVFNLLPIPPLDGSRLLGAVLDEQASDTIESMDQYAVLFLAIAYLIFQAQLSVLLASWYEFVLGVIVAIVGG